MFITYLILLIIPFIQIGFSYYGSFATLGVVSILIYKHADLTSILSWRIVLRGFAAISIVVATALHPDSTSDDVLRASREAVFLLLITGAANWRLVNPSIYNLLKLLRTTRFMFSAMLVLVVVQTLFLLRGAYFGIPSGFFSQNENTIATDLDLMYGILRPNGTFGEPSYLAGVSFSFLFALSPLLTRSAPVRLTSAIIGAVVLLSRSFSGALFCFAYVGQYLAREIRSKAVIVALCAVAVVGVTLALTTDNFVSDRVAKVSSGDDASAAMRMFQPLVVIPDILIRSPLGVTPATFVDQGYIDSVGALASDLTNNGLFNFFIFYGWCGFLVALALLSSFRDLNTFIFVALLSLQNGAILSLDKFVIISFAVMLYNTLKDKVAAQAEANVPVQRSAFRRDTPQLA